MSLIGEIVLSLYGLGALFVLVAIIILIIVKTKQRKKETFEKRDN